MTGRKGSKKQGETKTNWQVADSHIKKDDNKLGA